MKRGVSMLVATGLRKRFGDILALDSMDLTVAAGETTGLIGHNGAGKSTVMALAAGLLRPDSGAVTVAGVSPIRQPRHARALLGIAPQELALYPSLTVREHLRLFGRLAGVRGTALHRQIDQIAQAMCLTEVLDRPAGLLSGGQRRRTHTATALLHHPRVLLLDEPTAGADPTTREALLAAVRAQADAGTAVCYITHYLSELDTLQATVAVLAHGRVIARGARQDLLAALPSEVVVQLDTPVPSRPAWSTATTTAPPRAGCSASAPAPRRSPWASCCATSVPTPAGCAAWRCASRPLTTCTAASPASPTSPPARHGPMRPDLAGARQIGVLARHNLLLLLRDPGQIVAYTVMPAVLMSLLQPLYRAALHHGPAAAAAQDAAGMVVMFSLFALNVIGHSILSERTWRTWDRLRATPTSALELLAGKAVPLLTVLGAQQALLLGIATVAIGLRPAGPAWAFIPVGLAWSLCVLACGAALASSARSHGQLGTSVDIGALVATCLGGALIPLSALPAWLRSVAWVSPGYWAMAGYNAALTGQSATRLLPPCGVLLAIAVAAAALAATRTSHAQGRSRY